MPDINYAAIIRELMDKLRVANSEEDPDTVMASIELDRKKKKLEEDLAENFNQAVTQPAIQPGRGLDPWGRLADRLYQKQYQEELKKKGRTALMNPFSSAEAAKQYKDI